MSQNIQDQIENKIIDHINSGVVGRLIIYKPEKNAFGADLAVERRAKYKEKEIYFQVNSLIAPVQDNIFVKDFSQEKFKADKDFYLLFIVFDEFKQKTGDYIWLVPSVIFKDIVNVVTSEAGEKIFRFEVSLDIKDKNKYSRFLINVKELGKIILNALEKGGKFAFKEIDFEEKGKINLDNLKEFLLDARKNTFAGRALSIDSPRLLSSKQFEFQKGEYSYKDIYFPGERKITGQEIIYKDSKAVWEMNYSGTFIAKIESSFLKEALFKLAGKCRLGQTCEYEKREFKYKDQGNGNLENFSGQEEIFLESKSVYKLNYQGGLL